MLVRFYDYAGDCSYDAGNGLINYVCGNILVDVNGFNGPNILGRDLFYMFITKISLYPLGGDYITITSAWGSNYSQSCNPATATGKGCLGRILKEGAMNY